MTWGQYEDGLEDRVADRSTLTTQRVVHRQGARNEGEAVVVRAKRTDRAADREATGDRAIGGRAAGGAGAEGCGATAFPATARDRRQISRDISCR